MEIGQPVEVKAGITAMMKNGVPCGSGDTTCSGPTIKRWCSDWPETIDGLQGVVTDVLETKVHGPPVIVVAFSESLAIGLRVNEVQAL